MLFLENAYGIELALMEVLLIPTTAVATSLGTLAIPGGGVMIPAKVLESSGIAVEGLVVIIGIDRILERILTMVNVTGELTATNIFNKWYIDQS